jgi:hypothetical protein
MAELLDQNEIFWTPFEPKQANRFIMYIDGIPSFMVKMTDRPKLTSGVVTLDHINLQRKVKGKTTWQDLTISLYDPVVPSAAQAAMEWIRLSHEAVTGRDGYADFYKKDITLNALGPVGDKVEEWTIYGAFVTAFDGGSLDYSTADQAVNVNLTIAFDYAILQY